MKKFWLKQTAFVLVCLLLLGTLASCSPAAKLGKLEEAEQADLLYEMVDERMNKVKSCTTEMELELTALISGQKLRVEGSAEIALINGRKNKYTEITETEMTGSLNGKTILSQEVVEGFQNGNMFYSAKTTENDKDTEVKLFSNLDAEAYLAHREQMANSFDITPDTLKQADTTTCKMNDDGTWVATYTDFNKTGMEEFEKLFESYTEALGSGISIADIKVTLKTDKKLYPSTIEMEIEFGGNQYTLGDMKPACKMTLDFSDFNEVEVDKIDLSDYTEVDDLRAIDTVTKAMEDYAKLENGRFELNIDQTVSVGSRKEGTLERDVCSFATDKDGKFSYNITAKTNSYNVIIAYANGVQTTTVKQGSQSSGPNKGKQTEAEAKAFIERLMNPAKLDKNNIANIKDNGDGVYVFTLKDVDTSAFASVIKPDRGDKTGEVTVTMKDGKLVSLVYKLSVFASVSTGDVSIESISTCEYSYPEK
jgi:hypothetical protein